MQRRLFVGLGNPGKKYEMTRHNMGYLVVQAFAHLEGWPFKEEKRLHSQVAKGKLSESALFLQLPTTYMNESGRAVRQLADYFKISKDQIVVIMDDVDLPFGEIRLREKGGAGGHNGLRSIEKHLGTQQYIRMRIGVGRGHAQQPLESYVLENFSSKEVDQLKEIIEKSVQILRQLLTQEITKVMNVVNQRGNKDERGEQEPLRRDVCDQPHSER